MSRPRATADDRSHYPRIGDLKYDGLSEEHGPVAVRGILRVCAGVQHSPVVEEADVGATSKA